MSSFNVRESTNGLKQQKIQNPSFIHSTAQRATGEPSASGLQQVSFILLHISYLSQYANEPPCPTANFIE